MGSIQLMKREGSDAPTYGHVWITGQHALEAEGLSDEQMVRDLVTVLDLFPAIEIPRSFRVLRSKWGTDPLALGSYSYPAAGATAEDVSALGAPLRVGDEVGEDGIGSEGGGRSVVLFGGEATHHNHYGTAHGAFMSGQREARRFLAELDSVVKEP